MADGGLLWWLVAVAASAGFLVYAMSGAGRDATRRVRLDDGTVTVGMRRTFPVAAALWATTMALFLGVHAARAGDLPLRVVAGVCSLLFLAALPDLLRAALRRCRLTFDARGITVRSWAGEASVDWADVTEVDGDLTVPSRPALRVVTRPAAPSLVVRRRRSLLPLEPRPAPGRLVVPALPFDEPWLLVAALATLVGLTPDERDASLGHTARLVTGG